jgi:predicted aconitase
MAAMLGSRRQAFSSSTRSSVCAAPRIAAVRTPSRRTSHIVRAIELDFSDPDTQLSLAGLVLGLVLGIGAPAWYINRTERDEERLEELRAMNRATFKETGEYMTDVSGALAAGSTSCFYITSRKPAAAMAGSMA